MDRNKTIEILDALASGCSPTIGEMIDILGVQKAENLSEYVQNARSNHLELMKRVQG
ncbi:hypothetical protein J2X69_002077 [Algoriphagus sp. 4150]|uniref:hypothetical protein n=1 Tax=Algoriphagus sp. 4150 TaxID=2817756 RepID=UPI002854E0C4|nr:hypothetical protein [Algoriphagus sp. 4150]MDR7129732.1 hypothetical protein [Algoriphagus sp. 4150]